MPLHRRETLDLVKKAIDQSLKSVAEPIAAFDADGTLWHMDMGESFFEYQIQNKLLPGLPADPWKHYLDMHHRDTPSAFLWLAQINKGVPIEQVRRWSQAAFDELAVVPVFRGMQEIIQHLKSSGVRIYIVTASVKWAVEPGAEFLGIPRDNVLGIATKVKNGLVTDEQDGVITWREGKAKGLLNATGQSMPFLSAGNTMGDLDLLKLATHVRIVNCAVDDSHVNYSTERQLVEIAQKNDWFYFSN